MIFFKSKDNDFIINDELYVKGTNAKEVEFIQAIIDSLQDKFKPENGSPTLIIEEELKKIGYIIKEVELPFDEQINGTVF